MSRISTFRDRLMTTVCRWAADRRGNAVVIFGVVAPAIVGSAGLGVDAVSWYYTQRQLQVIADGASIAGAHVLYYEKDADLAEAAGEAEATARLSDRIAGTVIAVATPPGSGPNAGDNTAVEVEMTFSHPLYFAGAVFGSNATIYARAVARKVAGGEYCIMALDPTASRAAEFSGNANVSLGCGVIANSNAPDALYISGSTYLNADPAAAVGDIYIDGSATLDSDYPPQPLSPLAEDPYGPDGRNLQVPSGLGPCAGNHMVINGTVTLNPGRYCNGMHITSGTLTLNPGTYYIDGGTFKVTGGSTITGDGVTIVLTGSGGNYATLDIEGGSHLDLTAPELGSGADYEGVLIYQDQDAPMLQGAVPVRNKIVGGTDLALTGAIYIPNQLLEFSGGAGGSTECLQIIARQVTFTSETQIGNSCPANAGTAAMLHYKIKVVE